MYPIPGEAAWEPARPYECGIAAPVPGAPAGSGGPPALVPPLSLLTTGDWDLQLGPARGSHSEVARRRAPALPRLNGCGATTSGRWARTIRNLQVLELGAAEVCASRSKSGSGL